MCGCYDLIWWYLLYIACRGRRAESRNKNEMVCRAFGVCMNGAYYWIIKSNYYEIDTIYNQICQPKKKWKKPRIFQQTVFLDQLRAHLVQLYCTKAATGPSILSQAIVLSFHTHTVNKTRIWMWMRWRDWRGRIVSQNVEINFFCSFLCPNWKQKKISPFECCTGAACIALIIARITNNFSILNLLQLWSIESCPIQISNCLMNTFTSTQWLTIQVIERRKWMKNTEKKKFKFSPVVRSLQFIVWSFRILKSTFRFTVVQLLTVRVVKKLKLKWEPKISLGPFIGFPWCLCHV